MDAHYVSRMEQAYKHKRYFIPIIDHLLRKQHEREDNLTNVFRRGSARGYSVLDYGCGSGLLTYRVAQAYPDMYVVGYDASLEMVELARERYSAPNLYFTNDPRDDGEFFHFILFSSILHEIYSENPLHFSQNLDNILRKSLAPGGYAIIRDGLLLPQRETATFFFKDLKVKREAIHIYDQVISGPHSGDFEQIDYDENKIWGPMWQMAEFLNKLTWGTESIHRERNERFLFLNRERLNGLQYGEVEDFYAYCDTDYFDYLRKKVDMSRENSLWHTHAWAILRRPNV